MNIVEFSHSNVKQLRIDMQTALEEVANKHGISIRVGNMSFSPNNVNIKVEASVKNSDGETVDKFKEALVKFGKVYLNADFNIDHTYNTKQLGDVKFVGLNSRATKNPIIVQQISSGKKFVISKAHAMQIISPTTA